MEHYSRGYAAVDLDAIVRNMEAMKLNIADDSKIIGVVKADGYGHGAVPVAQAIGPYVEGYAVATIEEAVILRRHGIKKPVLVLGAAYENSFPDYLRHDIRATVFQLDKAEKLSALAADMGVQAKIHIAVDTGMSRIGFWPDEPSADVVSRISRLPGIRIEGLFTHFAKADELDKSAAKRQLLLYQEFVEMLKRRGLHIAVRHCSNSAGIIDLEQANLDMVRAGISIYGLYPSNEVAKDKVVLSPALELKSTVCYVKTIPSGSAVSYGGTFVADRDTEVATVPVGYGDGYPRSLSGKGSVLIRGKRAPILGRVCMDQFMADVTDIPGAAEGDQVTLIGKDGDEMISVEELADTCGGFHYEILCDIGKRIPRVYLKEGRVIGTKDYFEDVFPGFGCD